MNKPIRLIIFAILICISFFGIFKQKASALDTADKVAAFLIANGGKDASYELSASTDVNAAKKITRLKEPLAVLDLTQSFGDPDSVEKTNTAGSELNWVTPYLNQRGTYGVMVTLGYSCKTTRPMNLPNSQRATMMA